MASQERLFRFYRSNLPTIVWDPENNKALAEFVRGQFYTEEKRIADKLIELGYPQIPLTQTVPPQIIFEKGRSLAEGQHAKAFPPGMTEEAALQKEKLAAQQDALARKAKRELVERDPKTKTSVKESINPKDEAPATAGALSPGDIVAKARKQAIKTKKKSAGRKINRREKK